MTQTLTTEQVQEIYEAAVHVEATLGDPDAEFDLYCKLDDVGGVEATIRKLIDMLRAANREAQPVYQCRFFTTDVDGKQIGEWQDMDKGFYDQYDPYCRRILYTAPPAPAVVNGRTAEGWMAEALLQKKIADGLRKSAPAVPDAIEPTYEAIKAILPTANPDEYACCIGADMWNACRAAMLAAPPEGGNEK